MKMKEINETFTVRSLFPCEIIVGYESKYEHDPAWRQTVLGCMVLHFLQDMFHFKIKYPNDTHVNMTKEERRELLEPRDHDSVDIYVKPMELQSEVLDNAYPISSILIWRFGFVIRRQNNIQDFYTQPFTRPVWSCIYTMVLLASLVFYALSWWDHRLFGIESSYVHELLLAFSAYCQHILPLPAISVSRRIAYLSFILGAYVVHCFYTSNLLSYLVSERGDVMDLQSIADYDYQIVLFKDMNIITNKKKYEKSLDKNLSIVWDKVLKLQVMDLESALSAVIFSKAALLSDYITLYPIWKRYFEVAELCQLVEIDIYSNVKYYFFTSNDFPYKEEFKYGVLRAKEAGLLAKLLDLDKYSPISCELATSHYKVQFEHTLFPVLLLLSAYSIVLLILLAEKMYHCRNRVWPYVN